MSTVIRGSDRRFVIERHGRGSCASPPTSDGRRMNTIRAAYSLKVREENIVKQRASVAFFLLLAIGGGKPVRSGRDS